MDFTTYLQTILARLQSEDRGAGLAEYGLLLVLVALIAAVGLGALGGQIDTVFDNMVTALGG